MSKTAQISKKDINQRAFAFACRIIKLYQYLDSKNNACKVIGKQLLRSGTSIGANLEEATGGQSRADFISKNSIALKEARETLYRLNLLKESRLVSKKQLENLIQESNELVSIITAIVRKSRFTKK